MTFMLRELLKKTFFAHIRVHIRHIHVHVCISEQNSSAVDECDVFGCTGVERAHVLLQQYCINAIKILYMSCTINV